MAATEADLRPFAAAANWRTPLVIIVCGCAIGMLTFGPRSSFGFFIQPMSREFSWGRDVFGLALALQNLLWGLGQPVAGAIADRFGILRVMCVGAVLYAVGLLMMRYAVTPLSLEYRRRGVDRIRAVRLFVQSGVVCVQQAIAAGTEGSSAWRRNRRRIVRAIPVRAVRRCDDRQFRLADGADGIRRSDAADLAAFARARDPAGNLGQCPGGGPAVVQDRVGGSVRPSLLCVARARFLYLRLSVGFHHRASACLSGRPRHIRANRRLGDRRHRPVQHHRLAKRRLAAKQISKALHPVGDLFPACDVDRRFHLVSDHHVLCAYRSALPPG